MPRHKIVPKIEHTEYPEGFLEDLQEGYIKLFRSIRKRSIYKDGDAVRVWVEFLLTVRFTPGYDDHSKGVWLEPGQTLTSAARIGRATGIDSRQVQRKFEKLDSRSYLTLKPVGKLTLVTIRNWTKWQTTDPKHVTFNNKTCRIDVGLMSDSTSPSSQGSPSAPSKNGKEWSRSIHPSTSEADDGFDAFWKVYPRKVAKQDARKAWRKIKPDEYPAILTAIKVQSRPGGILAVDPWHGKQFIPHPANYLKGRRWEEVEAEPEQTEIPDDYHGEDI
jgi:hypothetical protein